MQPWIRASDADRERVVALLHEHTAAGRLTLDEFTARVDAANHAVTLGDLLPLTADLPPISADRAASLRLSAALAVGAIVLALLLLAALVGGIASWTRMGPPMR